MYKTLIAFLTCGLWAWVACGADAPRSAGAEANRPAATQPASLGTTDPEPPADAEEGASLEPAKPDSAPPRARRYGRGLGLRTSEEFLTPEQIDRLVAYTRENFPPVYERLVTARQSNPQQFRQMIHRIAKSALPILKTRLENPELADKMIAEQKAEMAIEELTHQYRNTADSARREQLREQIRQQLQAQFEARLERLRLQIRTLQRRLDDAKQNLADQEQRKQKLIEQNLSSITTGKGM